jgi:hypothetical protein
MVKEVGDVALSKGSKFKALVSRLQAILEAWEGACRNARDPLAMGLRQACHFTCICLSQVNFMQYDMRSQQRFSVANVSKRGCLNACIDHDYGKPNAHYETLEFCRLGNDMPPLESLLGV